MRKNDSRVVAWLANRRAKAFSVSTKHRHPWRNSAITIRLSLDPKIVAYAFPEKIVNVKSLKKPWIS
jgi:hypothetical protein